MCGSQKRTLQSFTLAIVFKMNLKCVLLALIASSSERRRMATVAHKQYTSSFISPFAVQLCTSGELGQSSVCEKLDLVTRT